MRLLTHALRASSLSLLVLTAAPIATSTTVATIATIATLATLAATATTAIAQSAPAGPARADAVIDAAIRSEVIDNIATKLAANYVFPDIAGKMASAIRDRAKRGEYNNVTSANAFNDLLTKHLQEVSHDKHIRVGYSKDVVPADTPPDAKPSAAIIERYAAEERSRNYGVAKYERLPGNIAYLELRGFSDPELGGEVIAGAMNLVAGADALIVDLRKNGGGDPAMVALVSSYLFDGEPVHLNDLYYRRNNETRQYWTHAHVSGKRYGPTKPVYVLTSERTFSGAEEFSYNLKNLKRATIIGAVTGGGANPGGSFKLAEHFQMFIPTGRAVSPITHTNWEGTGVKPDIEVAPDQALLTAQMLAVKTISAQSSNADLKQFAVRELAQLQGALDKLKAGGK